MFKLLTVVILLASAALYIIAYVIGVVFSVAVIGLIIATPLLAAYVILRTLFAVMGAVISLFGKN